MEYKDIVIDNDALVNTEPKELETEPQWIPQGKKPELNPNPGYGESGETKPAIVTVPVKGEVEVDGGVFTEPKQGVKGIPEVYNFLNGLMVGGKAVVPGEGGGSGGGFEVIEWDGERNFTEEEVTLLFQGKAVINYSGDKYYQSQVSIDNNFVVYVSVFIQDDGYLYVVSITVGVDGTAERFEYEQSGFGNLSTTKLYQHKIDLTNASAKQTFSHEGIEFPLYVVNNNPNPIKGDNFPLEILISQSVSAYDDSVDETMSAGFISYFYLWDEGATARVSGTTYDVDLSNDNLQFSQITETITEL